MRGLECISGPLNNFGSYGRVIWKRQQKFLLLKIKKKKY
jgi:hypothetical protein